MFSADLILANLQSEVTRLWFVSAVQHMVLPFVLLYAFRRERGGSIVSVYFGLTALLVSTLAVAHSFNLFNELVFALLGLALILGRRQGALRFPPLTAYPMIGYAALVAGYWYPHFVDSALAVLVRSPYSVVPCPSLLVILGVTVATGIRFAVWAEWLLVCAGLFYGITGVIKLRVLVDLPLIVVSGAYAARLLSLRAAAHSRPALRAHEGVLYERNQG